MKLEDLDGIEKKEVEKKCFTFPRIFTKEGLREFRKSDEFKQLKYYFAPNMQDKKYLVYNFLLLLLFTVFLVVFS